MALLRVVRNIMGVFMTALLVVMSASLALQIFSRQFLGFSFTWVPELAQLSMIAMVFFGSYVLVFDEDHIRVDFLEMYLSERGKHYLSLLRDLIVLVVVAVVMIGAYDRGVPRIRDRFPTVRFLRVGHVYFTIAATFALQGVWIVAHMLQTARALLRREPGSVGKQVKQQETSE